jgi:hypothetical protein
MNLNTICLPWKQARPTKTATTKKRGLSEGLTDETQLRKIR